MLVNITSQSMAERFVHDVDHRIISIPPRRTRSGVNLNEGMVKFLAKAATNEKDRNRLLIEGADDAARALIAEVTGVPVEATAPTPEPAPAPAPAPEPVKATVQAPIPPSPTPPEVVAAGPQVSVAPAAPVAPAPAPAPVRAPAPTKAVARAERVREAAKIVPPKAAEPKRNLPAPTPEVKSAVTMLLNDMPNLEFAKFAARARRLLGRRWPGGSPGKPVIVGLLKEIE